MEISDLDQEMIRQWIWNGAKSQDTAVDVELIEDFYDGQGIWNLDPQNPPPPPEIEEGFQIRVGPIFIRPSDIAAGILADKVFTIKYELLNDSPIEMRQISTIIGASDHFSCYKYKDIESAAAQNYGWRIDGTHQDTRLLFIFPQSDEYVLPQGTAIHWEENSVLDLQTHLINYSDDFILAQDVYVNIYTQEFGTAVQEMKFKNWGKTEINIPPNTDSYDEEFEIFGDNTSTGDAFVWLIGSHTHKFGLDFDIWLRNADGTKGEHIYDASNYNGIPECEFIGYNYEAPPVRAFNYPFLQLNLEQGLLSRAVYFNETDEPIVFGTLTAKEEMLGTGIFYVTDTTGVSFDDGSVCYADEINSISNLEKADKLNISIFPNPIKQNAQINIATYHTGKFIATLYDMNANMVRQESLFISQNNEVFSHSFEKGNLKNGIYFYEIRDPKGNRKVERLVISH